MSRVGARDLEIVKLSLICREDVLQRRLQKDIDAGIRDGEILERSIARIPFYRHLDTMKIDVADLSAV